MRGIGTQPCEFLFVVDNLKSAGAQKVLFTIVQALDRSHVRPVVWCLGEGGPYEVALRQLGVPVTKFGAARLLLGAGVLRMAAHLLRRRVVLMQSFLFHSNNLARALGRILRVPVVVASVRSAEITKPRWKRWVDRATAQGAGLTIAVSEAALAHAVRHEGVPAARAIVIRNGVDVRTCHWPVSDLDPRLPAGARIIGTVGRLGPEKAHGLLLEAFARLTREAQLVIVGDGPMRGKLTARTGELGIAERVHFLGFCNDVPRLLAAMEVFCLPSLFEGMSNALLEAMAMGRACVATSVPGNCELIEDGVHGLLVPPGDKGALATALSRLLEDRRLAARLGAAARERVEREFSLARMLRGYARAYAGALERKSRTDRRLRGCRLTAGQLMRPEALA